METWMGLIMAGLGIALAVQTVRALIDGSIDRPRWIGRGIVSHSRSGAPIRYALTLLLTAIFASFCLMAAGVALSNLSPRQWAAAGALLVAGASHVVLWRLRGPDLTRALERLEPASEVNYRRVARRSEAEIRAALGEAAGVAQRRLDTIIAMTTILVVGGVAFARSFLGSPSLVALGLLAFAIIRWRWMRRAISKGADALVQDHASKLNE